MPDLTDAEVPARYEECLRWAGLAPSQPTTLEIDLQPRNAYLHKDLTSRAVRAFHLNLVFSALAEAAVPCFVVPGLAYRNGVIGVPEPARRAALRVLRRLLRAELGYVKTRVPRPRNTARLLPGEKRDTWDEIGPATVLALHWIRCDPTGNLRLGLHEETCEIEFWTEDDGWLRSPRPNKVSPSVPIDGPTCQIGADEFTDLAFRPADSLSHGRPLQTYQDFVQLTPDEITFPVDVVYTWVDGADPRWLLKRAEAVGETYHGESGSTARFLSRDELRYSLRSLHANAPWVNKIWIVTDDQRPDWLVEDDRLRVVDHRDIFTAPEALPTFNSHAIETQLHHIDGLSEHFIYFNDDMFLGRPTTPGAFFLASGLTKIFYSDSRVPMGPITDQDTPVDAAAKNGRALLQELFGRVTSQTFKHTPYALRRSVLQEIEDRFPAAHDRTMRSQFRSTGDIAVPSSLHHYYALLSGRAVPSPIDYSYTQLAVPDLRQRLDRLLARRDATTFCLNDAYSVADEIEGQLAVLEPFLEAYFPVPSPWEKRP